MNLETLDSHTASQKNSQNGIGSVDRYETQMAVPFKSARRIVAQLTSAFIWFLTSIIAFALLFAYTLPQDLSRTGTLYASLAEASFFVRVLTFHLSLVLTILTLLALLIRRWALSVIAGAILLVAIAPTLVSLIPHDPAKIIGPKLRIMAMNLKYTHENGTLITDQIARNQPDVVVIEDYTPYAKDAIDGQFGHVYPYRGFLFNYLQGLAFYSKYPIEGGYPKSTFTKIRRQMRAVIQFNGQLLAIYVEHPFSPRSRQRIVNNRLATLDLVEQMRNERLPVVLAGDFNFTETTPNESALKKIGMQDGFELAGQGRGSTWPVEPPWTRWLPGVRIDHVFLSHQLTCTNCFVGEYDGSDHLPIVADIGFIAP